MASICKAILLDADPADVWAAVSDVGAAHERLVPGVLVDTRDEYADADKRRGDESREETARRVAWSAVNQGYAKGDDERWHAK